MKIKQKARNPGGFRFFRNFLKFIRAAWRVIMGILVHSLPKVRKG